VDMGVAPGWSCRHGRKRRLWFGGKGATDGRKVANYW
jgi:hypothetical protein